MINLSSSTAFLEIAFVNFNIGAVLLSINYQRSADEVGYRFNAPDVGNSHDC